MGDSRPQSGVASSRPSTDGAPPRDSAETSSRALLFDATLLLIFLGLVWGRYLSGASLLYSGDTFYYFYPLRFTLFSALHHGYFPDWESAALSGNPFCANPQANCYYPLSAWFALPDFLTAYQWAVVSHLALAGVGTWLWLNSRGHSRLAGVVAALVLMSGGLSLSLVNRLDKLESLSWWPWAMWGLERLALRRRGGLALVAGALSMALLAGGLEVWGMTVGALGVWAILVGASINQHGVSPLEEQPGPFRLEAGNALRLLAGLAAALVICLLICAPQWLELRQLLAESTRSAGVSFARATELSLHPGELWSVFFPHLFYNPADEAFHPLPGGPGASRYLLSLYLGWLPALAAFCSLRWLLRRGAEGRAVRASILLIALGLLMALGDRNPLYRGLFDLLSPLRAIRYPEKFLVLSGFFTLPLIAVGIDDWRRSRYGFLVPLGTGLGILAILITAPGLERLGASLLALTTGATPDAWMQHLEWLEPELRAQAFLLTMAGVVGLLWARGLLRERLTIALVAGLIGLDLWMGTWALNPPIDAATFRTPPELARALTTQSRRARVHVLSLYDGRPFVTPAGLSPPEAYAWLWQLLYPNAGELAAVRYADGSRAIRPDHPTRFFAAWRGMPVERQLELAALAGVDAVVATPGEVDTLELLPGVKRLARSERTGLELWGLTTSLPSAYIISSARYFSSWDALMEALLLGRYSPREDVGLVGSGTSRALSAVVGSSPPVEELEGGKRRVLEAVNAGLGGWLVFPESWYPGWTARVDGVPTPVLEANGYQQAVRLPAGVHRVELEYAPEGRGLGLGMSGVGVGLALLSLRRWKR